MGEYILEETYEEGFSPIEDIRDKIGFQLHQLFSFYEEEKN